MRLAETAGIEKRRTADFLQSRVQSVHFCQGKIAILSVTSSFDAVGKVEAIEKCTDQRILMNLQLQ